MYRARAVTLMTELLALLRAAAALLEQAKSPRGPCEGANRDGDSDDEHDVGQACADAPPITSSVTRHQRPTSIDRASGQALAIRTGPMRLKTAAAVFSTEFSPGHDEGYRTDRVGRTL